MDHARNLRMLVSDDGNSCAVVPRDLSPKADTSSSKHIVLLCSCVSGDRQRLAPFYKSPWARIIFSVIDFACMRSGKTITSGVETAEMFRVRIQIDSALVPAPDRRSFGLMPRLNDLPGPHVLDVGTVVEGLFLPTCC